MFHPRHLSHRPHGDQELARLQEREVAAMTRSIGILAQRGQAVTRPLRGPKVRAELNPALMRDKTRRRSRQLHVMSPNQLGHLVTRKMSQTCSMHQTTSHSARCEKPPGIGHQPCDPTGDVWKTCLGVSASTPEHCKPAASKVACSCGDSSGRCCK